MNLLCTTKGEARSNFAAQHLAAAEHFATQAAATEHKVPPSKRVFAPPEYAHYWFAAVVFSAMALEANIYELMTEGERTGKPPLGSRRFRIEDHRKPLLDRYALVYETALQGAKLRRDRGLAQQVRALVLLRDEIVHYKTEYRSNAKVSNKLNDLLRFRIPLNPYRCGDVFFPEQCVSVGGAKWAIATSRHFILEFASKTGVRVTVSAAAPDPDPDV